jgi:hypothetical protein
MAPWVTTTLNCGDVGFQLQVIVVDLHETDGNDNDNWGCVRYR